jgi:hypothetical protein
VRYGWSASVTAGLLVIRIAPMVYDAMKTGARPARCRRAVWGLLMVLVAAVRAETSPERVIRYEKDALTVHAVGVPVLEVLAEIGRQSGAEIRGMARDAREVTAQFDAVPLPQALYRLLGDQNYALIYGSGGKLRTLRLLGGSGEEVVLAAPAPVTAARPVTDLAPILDRQVAVTGPVADALKSPMVTIKQITDLWLQTEDTTLRDESAASGIKAMEAENDMRNSVVDFTQSHSDVELAQLLRDLAGSRAEELAAFVLSQTRVTELHMKAAAVLSVLQSGS